MTSMTALIVPAVSNQAGQCRIVAAAGTFRNPLAAYRDSPERWQEIGAMDSRGRIVALDDCQDLRKAFEHCEPCAAGMALEYESK